MIKANHHTDETELLQNLVVGNQYAFDLLYKRYSNRIYNRLLKLTQSQQLAEELLQDTFVILWDKRHTINPQLSVKAWLYKVAANEVYLFYRKLARDKKLQEHVVANFVESYTHTEEALYQKESRALLQQAMEQLPPQRREVFRLCKLEGHSYEETAVIMGISPSTVSNHLVKASNTVRQYIFQSQERIALLVTFLLCHKL